MDDLNTPSPGSESADYLTRISRIPRGAIADWEKRSLLHSGSGRRHAWDSRPTGRYRNLGSSLIWGLHNCPDNCEASSSMPQCVARARRAYMATACDHTTATGREVCTVEGSWGVGRAGYGIHVRRGPRPWAVRSDILISLLCSDSVHTFLVSYSSQVLVQ